MLNNEGTKMIKELISRGYSKEDAENIIYNWSALDKEKFNVQGFFYYQRNLKFRRFLEIKRKNIDFEKNDLSVIMMNPGSSRPKYIDENNYSNEFVEAIPDKTQEQIMRLMDGNNYNYTKIVNLSDYINGDSINFYEKLEKELKKCEHSIFSDVNKHYLINYLNPQSVFVFAWGVDKRLSYLSKQAIEVIRDICGINIKKIGIKHKKNVNGYYHPLPRKQLDQILWVKEITDRIKSNSFLQS